MSSWLLLACAGGPGDSGVAWDSEDTGLEGFEVSGQVVDLDGDAVVNVFVTVSTEFCIPDRTDDDGAFTVGAVSPGPKRLITYGETADNGLFASVAFAFDAEQAMVLAEPVVTPELTERIPLSLDEDQLIETTEGFWLEVAAGSLEVAPFMPEELQLARVPVEQAPPFASSLEVVDLVVLHPIQSFFSEPAPMAFPADLGLPEGTSVTFHRLKYETGALEPVATGHVDVDGHPRTDEGQGIDELTWIALTVENP